MSPNDYPEPPDPKRIAEMRAKLDQEQARRRADHPPTGTRFLGRFDGDQLRNVGTYTLIPAMLLAGPAVGYGLGWLVERRWGGSPWGVTVGALVGLVAAFRQIFLILADRTAPPPHD